MAEAYVLGHRDGAGIQQLVRLGNVGDSDGERRVDRVRLAQFLQRLVVLVLLQRQLVMFLAQLGEGLRLLFGRDLSDSLQGVELGGLLRQLGGRGANRIVLLAQGVVGGLRLLDVLLGIALELFSLSLLLLPPPLIRGLALVLIALDGLFELVDLLLEADFLLQVGGFPFDRQLGGVASLEARYLLFFSG
ncbi:hypothetical protein D9M69_563330 [compost metagenome]